MDIVRCSLFGSTYLRSALNVQLHAPPPNELSSHALCVSSRSSPFAVSHHQHHRHHHHHHSTCDSDFSTSICHVTLTFASKRVKPRNVGASPCFGWTEIFPSFCQSGDLLAHDVHIDKPKAWCQQKRARSHVGFRTEWSPASPVTQVPFVSPLLKFTSHTSSWKNLAEMLVSTRDDISGQIPKQGVRVVPRERRLVGQGQDCLKLPCLEIIGRSLKIWIEIRRLQEPNFSLWPFLGLCMQAQNEAGNAEGVVWGGEIHDGLDVGGGRPMSFRFCPN